MTVTRRRFLSTMLRVSAIAAAGGCIGNMPFPIHDEAKIAWHYKKGEGEPPVILRHEFLGDYTSMEPLAEHFNRLGHPTYSPDAPGHGESGDYLLGQYTPERMTQTQETSFQQFGIPQPRIGVGYSMGGMMTLLAGELFPNNYQSRVIIASANDGTRTVSTLANRIQQAIDGEEELFSGTSTTTEMARFDRDALQSLLYAIPRTKFPVTHKGRTLYIAGTNDEFFDTETQNALLAQLPAVRPLILDGVNHDILFSHTDRITDFIDENHDWLTYREGQITRPTYRQVKAIDKPRMRAAA